MCACGHFPVPGYVTWVTMRFSTISLYVCVCAVQSLTVSCVRAVQSFTVPCVCALYSSFTVPCACYGQHGPAPKSHQVAPSNTGNRLCTAQAIHVRKHLDLRLFFVCFLPICVSAVVGGQLLVTFVSLKGQSTRVLVVVRTCSSARATHSH